MKYRTLQITNDGRNYIFDYESNDKQELWDLVANQGSKWIFYPLPFIVKNEYGMDFKKKRIIDTIPDLENLKGMTISNAMKWLQDNNNYVISLLNSYD